ncbi:MAG: 3',5'-cyclic adenosine monophosphate phosphodiesterase CpdA [Chlamydiales bacterium]|nr:3',5'-cyclic adenosine monophosphate phosphodiesterase CpdA [Chlamydiales bacterium]
MRIAHLSDPHFSHLGFNWELLKSKRWLGFLNLFLFRQNSYQTSHLEQLPRFLHTLDVEHICVTGDFSSLALDVEFAEAKRFMDELGSKAIRLPGNHDIYTADSAERYYRFFPSSDLQRQRIEKRRLNDHFWWIGLDCARPNSLLYSNGRFFEQMEKILDKELATIPYDECVIIGNHFPLYPAGRPKHDLERCDDLLMLLERYPQVKLYLHGHDHTPYIRDKRILALNAGSCGKKRGGSFYLLDIEKEGCNLKRYTYTPGKTPYHWQSDLE